MENRGYRHYELEQDDVPRSNHWLLWLALAFFLLGVHACARSAYAEGEAITVHFACKEKATSVVLVKSMNTAAAMEAAVKQGHCVLYPKGRPGVEGAQVGIYPATIGGRKYVLALAEVYWDRKGAPWYAWRPLEKGEKEL